MTEPLAQHAQALRGGALGAERVQRFAAQERAIALGVARERAQQLDLDAVLAARGGGEPRDQLRGHFVVRSSDHQPEHAVARERGRELAQEAERLAQSPGCRVHRQHDPIELRHRNPAEQRSQPSRPEPPVELASAAAKGVVFTFKNPNVREVQLAGDFNNWIPDQGVETRLGPNGTWEKVVRLGPGVYQYRYFVDGEWQPDPSNPRRVEGPAGGVNSVLIIS